MSQPRRPKGSIFSSTGIPSWAIVASLGVIVVAVLAFFITGRPDATEEVAKPTRTTATKAPAPTPSPAPAPTSKPTKEAKEAEEVPRAYVEVFNNSGVTGLADRTSGRVQGAGWKVVGTDNWYGKIPATTVYYPKRLKGQAKLLAADLKIKRVRPATSPMKFDRLTLILTEKI